MIKTPNKRTKKKDCKGKAKAHKKAKAQALENQRKLLISNPKNSSTDKDDKPSDDAPYPTEDNGNSHSSNSSQSHNNNKIGYKESYCPMTGYKEFYCQIFSTVPLPHQHGLPLFSQSLDSIPFPFPRFFKAYPHEIITSEFTLRRCPHNLPSAYHLCYLFRLRSSSSIEIS